MVKDFQVRKSIILMSGIRHARQMEEGTLMIQKYAEFLQDFIATAKSQSPSCKILLMSSLSGEESTLSAYCQQINDSMRRYESDNVLYVDTDSRLKAHPGSMTGLHVKRQYSGVLAVSIKYALRLREKRRNFQTFNRKAAPRFQQRSGHSQNIAPIRDQVAQTKWTHPMDFSQAVSTNQTIPVITGSVHNNANVVNTNAQSGSSQDKTHMHVYTGYTDYQHIHPSDLSDQQSNNQHYLSFDKPSFVPQWYPHWHSAQQAYQAYPTA